MSTSFRRGDSLPLKDEPRKVQGRTDHLWAAQFVTVKPAKEAIVSTGFPALQQPGVKVMPKKESAGARALGTLAVHCRFIEKAAPAPGQAEDPNRFRVILIQEGLGNTGTGYYYTKDALKSAAPIFEGKKAFADHPSAFEDEVRPERSVRDIVGHYEGVEYLEADDTTGRLEADLVVLPGAPFDWTRSLLTQAVLYSKTYPDQDLLGLSINASGDAQPMPAEEFLEKFDIVPSALAKVQKAVADGLEEINITNLIDSATSVDLVTEAGAKGKVLELLEAENVMTKEQRIKEAKAKKTAAEAKLAEALKSIKAAGKDAKKLKEAEEHKCAAEKEAKEAEEALKNEGVAPAPKAPPAPAKKDDDGEGDDGDDGEHDDADADKALIHDQLKKHGLIQEGEEADGDMMKAAKHLHAAYKAGGASAEEAADAAAKHLKCAAAAKESMEAEEAAAKEANDAANPATPAPQGDPGKAPAKESADLKKKLLKTEGENAQLRERLSKIDREAGLDKMLKESSLPMSVTKKFRESVKDVKSLKDIENNFKIFMEGYQLKEGSASGEGDVSDLSDCILGTEKNEGGEDDEGGTTVDLADCFDND